MSTSPQRDEFGFIDWIKRQLADDPRITLGIGDDAAVIDLGGAKDAVVTTDMLMEGVDFTFPPATPYLAGRKSLAVNLSDLAAMAAVPHSAYISVALPRRGEEWSQEFFRGILDLAHEFNIAIAGGDTNSWNSPLVVNVTAIGIPGPRGVVTRSGAQPGDWIFVTGAFGGSIGEHHLTFTPRIRDALRLADDVDIHAMIDTSDGLAADLRHIIEQSKVGAIVDADAIPISDAARILASTDGRTALEHALGDGEDFELIFCVDAHEGRRLLDRQFIPCTKIGVISESKEYLLRDEKGDLRPMPPLGWVHRV